MNLFFDFIEKIIRFVTSKIFNFSLKESTMMQIIQFIKFCLVGLLNTLISYVTYIIFLYLGAHYLLSSIAGFILSVCNAFFLNDKYVFTKSGDSNRSRIAAFIKCFFSYAGTGLVLNNLLLILWVEIFNIPEMYGPIINLLVTIPLNFILNKVWAFRK